MQKENASITKILFPHHEQKIGTAIRQIVKTSRLSRTVKLRSDELKSCRAASLPAYLRNRQSDRTGRFKAHPRRQIAQCSFA